MSPVIQDTYRETQRVGLNGMVANQEDYNIITRVAEGAIPFGRAVVQGTLDNEGKIPSAGGTFRGISCRDPTLVIAAGETVDQYQDNENAGLLTRGVMWIEVPSPVIAGGNVFFSNTTGRLSSITEASTQIVGALWDSSAAAGQLAKVRLRQG